MAQNGLPLQTGWGMYERVSLKGVQSKKKERVLSVPQANAE